MKAMKTILVVMAAAGLAMAQAPAASKPKAPASQSVSGAAATAPSATPAKAPAKAPAQAAAAPTSKAKAHKPAAKPAKKAVVAAVAKPSAEKPAKPPAKAGKRDPFVSPVVRATAGPGGGPVCSTGKRCLTINEMVLRGIVKTPSGMIAVVSNAANRAYFLKENDPIFNGTVVKITGDSVIFKENTVDNLGRQTSREVVKRVNAPAV